MLFIVSVGVGGLTTPIAVANDPMCAIQPDCGDEWIYCDETGGVFAMYGECDTCGCPSDERVCLRRQARSSQLALIGGVRQPRHTSASVLAIDKDWGVLSRCRQAHVPSLLHLWILHPVTATFPEIRWRAMSTMALLLCHRAVVSSRRRASAPIDATRLVVAIAVSYWIASNRTRAFTVKIVATHRGTNITKTGCFGSLRRELGQGSDEK